MACRFGESTPGVCAAWLKTNGKAVAKDTADEAGHTRLPWAGAAMGTGDLGFLTARCDPKLIALIGPHNAGKTTLLGAWYQLLGRSGKIGPQRFAGSYSLACLIHEAFGPGSDSLV